MTVKPLVSVIINCYNGEKYLSETIDSVQAQTYKNWEIIFWDNQSTDSTASIIKSYNDTRIRYFFAPEHTSLGKARNYALKECSGEIISFLDSDDLWLPEFLENVVSVLDISENIGIVYSRFINFEGSKEWLSPQFSGDNIINLSSLIKCYNIGMSGAIIKKSVIEQSHHIFDERFSLIEDFDFFVCNGAYCSVYYVSEPLMKYRWHNSNSSRTKQFKWFEEVNCFYEKAKTISELSEYLPVIKNLWAEYKVRDLLIKGEKRDALGVIISKSLANPAILRYLYPLFFGMERFHQLRTHS